MSDAEAPVVAAEGAGESKGMPQSDLDFLMACCNNTTGGALQVCLLNLPRTSIFEIDLELWVSPMSRTLHIDLQTFITRT